MKARLSLLGLCAALAAACIAPQEIRVVQRWNDTVSTLDAAVPLDEGILVVRRLNVRTVQEVYGSDGLMKKQTYSDLPLLGFLPFHEDLYLIEEKSPNWSVVSRIRPGVSPEVLTGQAFWTHLVRDENDHVLAFQSLYSSRDVAPSGLRIRDLTRGRDIFEDQFAFHYPVMAGRLFLVSPIDRKVRVMAPSGVGVIGEVVGLESLPAVRHDKAYIAWFGPDGAGPALFLSDSRGVARRLKGDLAARPLAWLGRELVYPEQATLTGRWTLKRVRVPEGEDVGLINVPAGITPSALCASPRGDFVGLPRDNGSMLVRLSDGFEQVFEDVPLSAWRFSPDGRLLYLVSNRSLQIVRLD